MKLAVSALRIVAVLALFVSGSAGAAAEEPDSIPAGYASIENPIVFDPTTYQTGPHQIGARFTNGPIDGSTATNTGQTSDVAIVTMENGQPTYDACYVLVDYSNEGCDENRDGQVTFEDVPLGTYTVHQTADLGPGRSVSDFTIQVTGNVSPMGSHMGWEVFAAYVNVTIVDIALITRDPETGDSLTGACYVLVGYSNEGCDENDDGQVTFSDIPFGTYTVHQTRTPAGYPTIHNYDILVEGMITKAGWFAVPLGFVVKQAPEQNAPGTRNVSLVLIDINTQQKVVAGGGCVELVGATLVGCDDDVVDGQIDFLDVPAGGPYELRFINLPTGYEEVGEQRLSVTIDADPGAPANRIVFVPVVKPINVPLVNPIGDAGNEHTELTEVVGETGFTLPRDGVTASGTPGVAPVGTTVRAQMVARDLPDVISECAEPVGIGREGGGRY